MAVDKIARMQNASNAYALGQIDASWETWSPTLTWSPANPVTPTIVATKKKIGSIAYFNISITSTDGNGATSFSCTLPYTPKTRNVYTSCPSVQAVGSSYSARASFIQDDGSNNNLICRITTATSGQTLLLRISGSYEV